MKLSRLERKQVQATFDKMMKEPLWTKNIRLTIIQDMFLDLLSYEDRELYMDFVTQVIWPVR